MCIFPLDLPPSLFIDNYLKGLLLKPHSVVLRLDSCFNLFLALAPLVYIYVGWTYLDVVWSRGGLVYTIIRVVGACSTCCIDIYSIYMLFCWSSASVCIGS